MQLIRSSIVQPEKWGSGTGDGGEPHRERMWKENRQGDWKCQWITPSSSVNLGTLCVGMADAAPSGPATHQHLPVFLYASPGGISSLCLLATSRFLAFMITHCGHC